MFKNYFKIIYRNLLKHKILSLFNIPGLALGMAAFLFIFLYISFENSYDDFHESVENIYRLNLALYNKGTLSRIIPYTPCPLAASMKSKLPEVKEAARLVDWESSIWKYKNKSLKVDKTYRADATFLTMFSFPLTKGDRATALRDPYTVVLSESLAKKIFGDENPMNKQVTLKHRTGDLNFLVTGVFKDFPKNSHLQINLLFSIHDMIKKRGLENEWYNDINFSLYVLLHPGTSSEEVAAKLNKYLEKEIYNEVETTKPVFSLQPLRRIHLYSGHLKQEQKRGSYETLYIFSILGLFIIIVAWINYINIVTARSIDRAGEVGVRKVVGATRNQLFQQFLLESLLLNILGIAAALILIQFTLPWLNQLFHLNLSMSILNNVNVWLPLSALFLGGALCSAIYPAFILSSFRPVSLLTVKLKSSAGGKIIRKGLVLFQTCLSVFLIASTLTIFNQIDYMTKQNLGISLDRVILVLNPTFLRYKDAIVQKGTIFAEELPKHPEIKSISFSNFPGEAYFSRSLMKKQNSSSDHLVKFGFVDYNFLDTYESKLIAGRNFSKEFSTDMQQGLLINEEAVKIFNFKSPEKAVGQGLTGAAGKFKIIGVIKNYHQQYLKEAIEPVGLRMFPYSPHTSFSVKLNTNNVTGAIEVIRTKYKEFFPDYPFVYSFADEFFNRQYNTDRLFGKMVGIVALLAILIACTGLFALSMYTVGTRTKEIGIRKICGATVSRILYLLLKDYIYLVGIANIVTLPIAFFITKKWLENYAYQIEIGWWFFMIPFLIVLLSTFVTVGYHVFKIAKSNPVNSLRYE